MFNNLHIILTVVLCVTFQCNGHLGLLDIVGNTHEHIHSTVGKVAGGILGGLNLNFQGHLGIGGQRHPNPPPPHPPPQGQQTIVLVVEENSNENNDMRPNQYGGAHHPNRPGYNNNQGQWNGNYNSNHQGSYGNHNYDQYHNGNQNQHNGNYGRPNQNPNQGQNTYQQRPDQYNGNNGGYNNGNNQNNQFNQYDHTTQGYHENKNEFNNQGGYNNVNNQGTNQHDQSTQGYHEQNEGNNHYNQQTTPKQEETRPTFGSIHVETTDKLMTEKSTEKDEPLFVPLNNYNYVGGDGKVTNGPKREVDNDQKTEDKDEDLPIDIRFQDQ